MPKAMVLVYEPRLTHSVWQDFYSRHRTENGLERRLRAGVRNGEWVAWRIIEIKREAMGNERPKKRAKKS